MNLEPHRPRATTTVMVSTVSEGDFVGEPSKRGKSRAVVRATLHALSSPVHCRLALTPPLSCRGAIRSSAAATARAAAPLQRLPPTACER